MIPVHYDSALPASWRLAAGRAAVFAVELDLSAEVLRAEHALLDEAERARAMRFHTTVLQRRYIAAHGFLRRVLGATFGLPPAEIAFVVREDGKPKLAGSHGRSLWFNLSHSAHVAVIALSSVGEVGVDIEAIRRLPDADDVAARVFTSRERDAIARRANAERDRAFFEAWTRKEAYIKATGEGLRASLRDIDICPESSSTEHAVLHGRGASVSELRWRVLDLELWLGMATALAAPCGTRAVECYPSAAHDLRSRADSGEWCPR